MSTRATDASQVMTDMIDVLMIQSRDCGMAFERGLRGPELARWKAKIHKMRNNILRNIAILERSPAPRAEEPGDGRD